MDILIKRGEKSNTTNSGKTKTTKYSSFEVKYIEESF